MHNPSDRFGTPDDCAERPLHEITAVSLGHQRAVHGRPLTGIGNKFDLLAPYCADEGATIEGVQTWPQLVLHLGLLCQIKCVIDLDSKIAHRAFNFSVSK